MTRDERTSALLSLMRADTIDANQPARCELLVWEAERELAGEEGISEAADAASEVIDVGCARGWWIL